MAVQISGLLTPRSGNYVAQASNIAITLGSETKTLQAEIEELIDAIPATAADIKYDSSASSETIKKKIDDINTALSSLGTSADKISYTKSGEETTVKAVLDELVAASSGNASNIDYSYTTESEGSSTTTTKKLNVVLDEIRESLDGVSDISDSVATAQSAAANASQTKTQIELILSAINTKVDSIDTVVNEGKSTIQSTITEGELSITSKASTIDSLSEIASNLKSAFDASDLEFEILSENDLSSMSEDDFDDGKIYFGYKVEDNSDGYYTITLTSNNTSFGYVIGSGTYKLGSLITFKAIPYETYKFNGWYVSGVTTAVSTDSTYNFTLSKRSVTDSETSEVTEEDPYTEYQALFEKISFTITAVSDNDTYGTVSGGGTYEINSEATLKATANDGYTFSKWIDSDNNEYTNATIIISSVNNNKTFTAYFTES